MSRGTATMFDEFLLDALSKLHDISTETIRIGIVDATITPAADDGSPRWGDYSANEVTDAGGYPPGGLTLTTVVLSVIAGVVTLTSDDASIPMDALGFINGHWGIIYNDDATNDEALGYIDLGGPVSEQAAPVVFEFPAGVVGEWRANVGA